MHGRGGLHPSIRKIKGREEPKANFYRGDFYENPVETCYYLANCTKVPMQHLQEIMLVHGNADE